MSELLRVIKRNNQRIRKGGEFSVKFCYAKFYKKLEVCKNTVLIESYSGRGIFGSPFYILQELAKNKRYRHLKIFVSVTKKSEENAKVLLDFHGIKNVILVERLSTEYCKLLASANYLVNNSTFPSFFIKKKDQIYLNTWHGTPLKTLGMSLISDAYAIGNTQRNYMMADYLQFPNEYTFEHLRKDYCLDEIFKNKYLLTGYARNDIFFKKKRQEKIRNELGLVNKKVVVFMPTWRGLTDKAKNSELEIYFNHALSELNYNLNDDFVIYAKAHNMASLKKLFNGEESRILPFPSEYETYEILSIADCLITDYSSVMFDFACTGRKIILYAYDEERYLAERGLYIPLAETNFCVAKNSLELTEEVRQIDVFSDYGSIRDRFCSFETSSNSKTICRVVFNNKKISKRDCKVIDGTTFSNKKPNLLVFCGGLKRNGITSALRDYLNNISRDKYNVFLTFFYSNGKKNYDVLSEFKDFYFFPIQGSQTITKMEGVYRYLYFRLNLKFKFLLARIDKMYSLSVRRLLIDFRPDLFINYSSYERSIFNLARQMPCPYFAYIHNDMKHEYKIRHNFHLSSFVRYIKDADRISVLSKSNEAQILELAPSINKNKLVLSPNFFDSNRVIELSKEEMCFNERTLCNRSFDEVVCNISNPKNKIIITVGRFSIEKNHEQLIRAFEKFAEERKEYYLVILGSQGPLFHKTVSLVEQIGNVRVILIQDLINPFPFFKHADLFVLPSIHEGAPMVMREAKSLNIPVVTNNIYGLKTPADGCVPDDMYDGTVFGLVQLLEKFEAGGITNKKYDFLHINKALCEKTDKIIKELINEK